LHQAESEHHDGEAGDLRQRRLLAKRDMTDQQREARHQRREQSRAGDAEQHHGAGEQVDCGRPGKHALHHLAFEFERMIAVGWAENLLQAMDRDVEQSQHSDYGGLHASLRNGEGNSGWRDFLNRYDVSA
jgi:hypothetical protein